MKKKSDALEAFKDFLMEAECQLGKKLKVLCTNGGGEYFSAEFIQYLKNSGIIHEKTNPNTPQENGMAECVNRTLVTMSIAMLKSTKSNIGHTAWPYALQHATLIKNIVPHSSLPNGVSPYELWTGNKPSVSTICTFGCKATLTIPDKHHDKLSSCSMTGIHLGLAVGKKAFMIYDPATSRVHESCDVHFFEGMPESEWVTIEVPSVDSPSHVVEEGSDGGDGDDDVEASHEGIQGEVEGNGDGETGNEGLVEPWQSGHECWERVQDNDNRFFVSSYSQSDQSHNLCPKHVGMNYAYMVQTDIPCTYIDAMNQSDSNSWLEACQDELLSLKETWTYVPVSTDEIETLNIIGCHWVFTLKGGPDGSVEWYKVRIVVKGFSQSYQINYDETFAPVVKWDSIHILLALAACLNLEVHQMDIKTAFLNGDLNHMISMNPPLVLALGFLV